MVMVDMAVAVMQEQVQDHMQELEVMVVQEVDQHMVVLTHLLLTDLEVEEATQAVDMEVTQEVQTMQHQEVQLEVDTKPDLLMSVHQDQTQDLEMKELLATAQDNQALLESLHSHHHQILMELDIVNQEHQSTTMEK